MPTTFAARVMFCATEARAEPVAFEFAAMPFIATDALAMLPAMDAARLAIALCAREVSAAKLITSGSVMTNLQRKLLGLFIILSVLLFVAMRSEPVKKQTKQEISKLADCQDKIGSIRTAREYIKTKTKDKIIRFDVINPRMAMGIIDDNGKCLMIIFSNYCYQAKSSDRQREFRVSLVGENYNWRATEAAFDILTPIKSGCDF